MWQDQKTVLKTVFTRGKIIFKKAVYEFAKLNQDGCCYPSVIDLITTFVKPKISGNQKSLSRKCKHFTSSI